MQALETLDLRNYRHGSPSERARFAEALRAGICELGFVAVEGHAIEPSLTRAVYQRFEEFFGRSEDEKNACSGVAGGQRGFTPFGIEHARDSEHSDLKEFFHVGQPASASNSEALAATLEPVIVEEIETYPRNVWPDRADELAADCIRMFRALERCATELLTALAESFGLPPGTFSRMIHGGNSILRALHYPPLSENAPARALRAAPHEDINLITLLCEASGSGLEILPPGKAGTPGDWIPVEVPPGLIVVDSGDMLSRVTNDLIPATTHRVSNPVTGANQHRYSLPFFAHPRPSCDLSVIDHFVTAGRPCAYPPITAGQFLSQRLEEIGLLAPPEPR